jgi:hypothetical protein
MANAAEPVKLRFCYIGEKVRKPFFFQKKNQKTFTNR